MNNFENCKHEMELERQKGDISEFRCRKCLHLWMVDMFTSKGSMVLMILDPCNRTVMNYTPIKSDFEKEWR